VLKSLHQLLSAASDARTHQSNPQTANSWTSVRFYNSSTFLA